MPDPSEGISDEEPEVIFCDHAPFRDAIAAAEAIIAELEGALRDCQSEASDAIQEADGLGEEETYCFGNLIHVGRIARAALSTHTEEEP